MKDPNEALSNYYRSAADPAPSDDMLAQILKKGGRRKQKLIGGVSGFVCGSLLAAFVLAWAMRPTAKPAHDNSDFIARMQLINSGLASRSNGNHGAMTR